MRSKVLKLTYGKIDAHSTIDAQIDNDDDDNDNDDERDNNRFESYKNTYLGYVTKYRFGDLIGQKKKITLD